MRLSIEISPEQHQRLKASAALNGQSIKDYVLARTLPDISDNATLEALEGFLKPRIAAARRGEFSEKSVDEIFDNLERNHR